MKSPPLPVSSEASMASRRRGRSGCQSCRRRSKKCDETRPKCSACQRLQLDCSYAFEYGFRLVSTGVTDHGDLSPKETSLRTTSRQPRTTAGCIPLLERHLKRSPHMNRTKLLSPPNNDAAYMAHFEHSVCFDLLGQRKCLVSMLGREPCVRYALLSLSASHLAVLQGSALRYYSKQSPKRSFTDSAIHRIHHQQSVRYAKLAEAYLSAYNSAVDMKEHVVSAVFAKVILAFYYHMAIDHLHFRAVVGETLNLVRNRYRALCDSVDGEMVLRCWYRLHLSCRPSKSPSLPLDGEEPCSLFPTFTSSSLDDRIDLECNLRLSRDDLIYSILIKTIELRSRLITVRCVTTTRKGSEPDVKPQGIGNGQALLSDVETNASSNRAVQSHLFELLHIQERRLDVWKTMVKSPGHMNQITLHQYSSHREAMNWLYCLLCELIILEMRDADDATHSSHTPSRTSSCEHTTSSTSAEPAASLLNVFFSIVDDLDYTQSNLRDTYTFSLTEILRQLMYSWPSQAVFEHILNIIWPKIERHGPGFEHSHLPTGLAKRFMMFLRDEHARGRHVVLTTNMMPEDTPKTAYLDADNGVEILVYTATSHYETTLQSVRADPLQLSGGF